MSNRPPLRRLNPTSGLMQRPKGTWGKGRQVLSQFPGMTKKNKMDWFGKLHAGVFADRKERWRA